MEKMKEQGKNKKRLALAVLAVLLAAAAVWGVWTLFFKQEEKVPITGTTTFGALNEAIEGSGTTTPADSVSYSIDGTVLEWYVEAGQDVKAGDLLYVLDSSDAREEKIEAEVALEELYEQLEELDESIAGQTVTAEFSGRVEGVKHEAGDRVQGGTVLATLVDDSTMKATLYFSYLYENDIAVGMPVTASLPEQMLNLTGEVTDIRYVDYVTSEGMKCFAVSISVDNPGSLTAGTKVTAWITGADGSHMYAVNDAELDYHRAEELTAVSGELSAVNVADYQRVSAGETLFVIDASGYATQRKTVLKQIQNHEENVAELQEAIDTEYTRYADIDGQVVTANYQRSRMTGNDVGTVTIYNQDSMKITVNIDELDADYLKEGMDVYLYRTTSSKTVSYPATLTYLSLEATSGSSGVSTFAAEITIDSKGELSSGVTVYYSIDTSESGTGATETVLAPVAALASYDEGYYLIVESEKKPETTIDPEKVGGSVTDYPKGYYAVPVEVGDYNGSYIQILSGVEKDTTVFLRYMNARPSGGDETSVGEGGEQSGMSGMPSYGQMPNFGSGQMPSFSGGQMPSFSGGQMGGQMGGSSGNRGGSSGTRANRG